MNTVTGAKKKSECSRRVHGLTWSPSWQWEIARAFVTDGLPRLHLPFKPPVSCFETRELVARKLRSVLGLTKDHSVAGAGDIDFIRVTALGAGRNVDGSNRGASPFTYLSCPRLSCPLFKSYFFRRRRHQKCQ